MYTHISENTSIRRAALLSNSINMYISTFTHVSKPHMRLCICYILTLQIIQSTDVHLCLLIVYMYIHNICKFIHVSEYVYVCTHICVRAWQRIQATHMYVCCINA